MAGISVAVAVSTLDQPFKQALHTVAALQADGIEIDARVDFKPSDMSASAVRQLRKILDDLNLPILAVRFSTRRGYDCIEDLDRRVTATKNAMRMAVELGCGVLVNSVGTIKSPIVTKAELTGEETTTDAAEMILLREVLSDLARYSDHYGCFLACETGTESLTMLANFLRKLPEPSVFIALNPSNLVSAGFDTEDLKQAIDLVRCVYAADTVPDRSRSGNSTPVPLGHGLVDFPQIVSTLEDCRFRGPYIVDGRRPGNATENARQAIEFLKRM